MKKILFTVLFLSLILFPGRGEGEEYKGVEIPTGELAFADKVVLFEPEFSGSPRPDHPNFIDPDSALGPPDCRDGNTYGKGAVSLGAGGRIVLEFTDNYLTGSDSLDGDLVIFEFGPEAEGVKVEISKDGKEWFPVGKMLGKTGMIDIDAFGFSSVDQFRFVRLTDEKKATAQGGDTHGADLDAVAAISTVPVYDSPAVSVNLMQVVTFDTAPGYHYQLQESRDGGSWEDIGSPVKGDGDKKTFYFELKESATQYRLKPGSRVKNGEGLE